ncbi:MAG TPA: quinolinate synthase NadA [Bacteroidales bacterium]|jgi:quinolinate synthase|nr:quinolinate synthase NadA [Bacteroidales bacterium]
MDKNIINNILLTKGFVDVEIEPGLELVTEIKSLSREKNAVILAHYYQDPKIQDIADFVGDSLYLSQQAAKTNADVIVFCGVHFMAETAKILCPEKKVLLPDRNAGCSLADSCKGEDFSKFLKKYPGHTVVSYINTTAEIKALSDIICTSSNAVQIIQSIPEDQPIVFAPDKNLGNYIESITGRKMVIWNGACHVHEEFSLERILDLKRKHPDAKIIAHPECRKPVLIVADFIGSTSALLKYTMRDDAQTYIVATESGILHQMKKANPAKTYVAAPPLDSTCGCSDCIYMKLNTIKKLYNCLKFEMPEIHVEENLRKRAETSILRMLEISEKLGL